MIAPIIALAGAALAAPQPTPANQPYVMQKASSIMVNYGVKYRHTDVPEAEASAVLNEVVGSMLAPAQATQLARSFASYYAVNGPQVTGPQAEQLVSKASSYYDNLATNPAYKDFASKVHEKSSMFDVYRGINDAQAKLLSTGEKHQEKANKISNKAQDAYSQLKADPAGAKAISSGKQLASRVAADFGVNMNKVKAQYVAAKMGLANLLSH